MKLTVLFFARLRETLGCDAETLVLPAGVGDIASLRDHLVARGGAWQVLAGSSVRAAVNQDMATPDTALRDGDEVAFFPPVTGG
ncbi:MAG: molybdopterin converting factor subunit 1 [Moraxellaceae bacterium]|nr:molybdopterin converting factor subunit 1 [Moraxellaceae bacterium]